MTDEKKLFRAIRSKSKEEPEATFQYIYIKYKPLITFVIAQYIKNVSDIEDITQETFISFFNNVENVHTSIKSYLTMSCKNIALNFLKKNKNISYVDMEEFSLLCENATFDNLANDRFIDLINDMKKVISEEDINIILLHLIADLKFEQIALKLGQNVKTIKTRYYRALKKYKKTKGAE